MKKNTNYINDLSSIDKLETLGDECFDKDTFNGCLSALDIYLDVQSKLCALANDVTIDDGIDYPHFKSNDMNAKIKYLKLVDKIAKVNKKLSDPKIASK